MPPPSAKRLERFRADFQAELSQAYPLLDTALIAALVYDADDTKESKSELHRQLAQLTLDAEPEQQEDWMFSFSNDEQGSSISPSSTAPDDPSPSPKDFSGNSTGSSSSASSTLSFSTPLGFLQTAFPSTPQEILIQAIESVEREGADDVEEFDMEAIIMEVLNIEAIRELGERGLEKQDYPRDRPPNWSNVEVKKSKKGKKKKVRGNNTLIIGPSTTIRFVPPPGAKQEGISDRSPISPSRPTLDPWTQMSSLASRLSSLFPGSSDTHFLSLFHDPKFQSPSKALRHDLTRRGSSWTMTPIFDETLFSFLGILGIEDNEEEGFEDASLCLRASEENIGIALDLMLLLQEMDAEGLVCHSSPSSPTSPTMQPPILAINHLKSETQSARKISYAESSKSAISEDRWTRVRRPQKQVSRKPEETQTVTTQPGPSGSRVQEPSESDEDLSEEECRYWAQYYRSKREEMLSSASQHWKRGPHAKGGEIAQYYAEESRSYDRKSREWALKAARAMVSKQKTTVNGPSVDLHGLTLHEALTIVREKVNEWWNSAGAGGVPSRHLTIITGVGNHSANRKAVLAPAVYNALTRDGWRVTKKPGQLHVTGLERSATGRANR